MKKKDLTPTEGKTKKTLEQLVNFRNRAAFYRKIKPQERSKVTFALLKMSEKYEKTQIRLSNELQEKVTQLNVQFASLKDGNLIENRFDFKGMADSENTQIRYAYTAEKKIELEKALSKTTKEYQEKEIEIEPFFVEIPEDFDFEFYEDFVGFIFAEISEEEQMERYLKAGAKAQSNGQKPTIEPLLKG